MILPDNLAPLPVPSRGDDAAGKGRVNFDDFVTAGDVRKVLLGTKDELPVEGLPAEDFDSFAGRSDVPYPSRTSPAATCDVTLKVPDLAFEPPLIHPAFELLKPEPRRAAPPRARQMVDCEASYGRPRISDAWWVMGMGAAAAAILFSGTLANFVSRESMRRGMSQQPMAAEVFRGAVPSISPAEEKPTKALAAAALADEEP